MPPISYIVHSNLSRTLTQGKFLLKSPTTIRYPHSSTLYHFVTFGTDDHFFPWLPLCAFPDLILLLYGASYESTCKALLLSAEGLPLVFVSIIKYTKSNLISRP